MLGITLSLNVYGVSATSVGAADSKNSTLSQVHATSTNLASTSVKKTGSNVVSKSITSSSTTKPIKVLIYYGNGAITHCVAGVETGLNYANKHNLVPGYRFTYTTTKIIQLSTLNKYNVLVMPGGSSGKNYINTISGTAIRKFVSSGHGYLGICAGAYAGSKTVSGLYNGWGVAPHVYSKHVTHEGNLKINILSSGSKLFGSGGTITMAHYNGPAMYAHGNSIVTFATYADNRIGYKNYGAIVGDTYGKGRTVLSGPHPELTPQNPNILAKLIAWTAKVTVNNGLTLTSANPVNGAVDVAANKIIRITFNKPIKFKSKNIELKTSTGIIIPITKSISSNILTITHPLLNKGVKYTIFIHAGSISDLLNKGNTAYLSSFTISSLTSAQMKDGLKRAQSFYKINHRLPNYISFGTKKIAIGNFLEIISAYNLKMIY